MHLPVFISSFTRYPQTSTVTNKVSFIATRSFYITNFVDDPLVVILDDHDLFASQIPLIHEFDDDTLIMESSIVVGKPYTCAAWKKNTLSILKLFMQPDQ